MYARTTLLEIDTFRVSLDDAVADVRGRGRCPGCGSRRASSASTRLTHAGGRAMLITFWDTAEHADAGAEGGWYPDGAGRVHDACSGRRPGVSATRSASPCRPSLPAPR